MENYNDKVILLFDGVCNFCNSTVNFVIKHDKKDKFRFAPLQSESGNTISNKFNLNASNLDTMILIENGIVYTKSSAALRVNLHLNGLYPLLYGFVIVPSFIRDAIYKYVANHRYKWFGKRETCMIPDENIKRKFISF